ncbi:MAG: flagellar biosynthesis protein FlhF [Lachnospiraceae bacterium]|nr:flagellar biosynthesis protein FlhF [Lachnospiraceae bacterium]
MIIKKFEGKTEEEAVQVAKRELGNGVVIMNVRNVKKRGFLSLFKRSKIEVTVALEDEKERIPFKPGVPIKPLGKNQSLQRHEGIGQRGTVKDNADSKTLTDEKKRVSGSSLDLAADENIRPDLLAQEEKKPQIQKKSADIPSGDKLLEEKLDNLQSFIEKQLAKENETKESETESEPESGQVSYLKLIYNTLIDNEVAERYANEVIDELGKADKDADIDMVLSNVYQKLILKFGQPKTITPAKKGAKVVFFIGPTGVGKTTTIAKIASNLCVNDQKKVVLLTADTYRVGAAEQLRTYAGILNIPFRVIYSADEMKEAIDDFKQSDYILVDTAGHSHNNDELKTSMSQIADSVEPDIEKEIFLVLSATTKYRDLMNIVDSYTDFNKFKLIFTKLDETGALGNLLNIRMYTGADMSYVTCGQSVPDDIEPFSPQSTVKQLLGGK